jgi:hypothetical protein
LEAAYAASHDSLSARAFLVVGELEVEDPPDNDGIGQLMDKHISNVREMAAILESRCYRGFELKSQVVPDEYHTSVFPIAVSRGLRYIYSDR